MTDNYIDERRRYIDEVKKSFEPGYEAKADKEESASFSTFRFQFIVALFLFCVFFYCDYTGTKIGKYEPKEIIQIISENDFYQKLENYVMINYEQE